MTDTPSPQTTTTCFSWRLRLGILLAAYNPIGLKQAGRWLIWNEVARLSPGMSDMERNIRFRNAAERVVSELGLKG